MTKLINILTEFDEKDVKALDAALGRFAEYKKTSGVPDYSPGFVAYTPVLAFALLKAQSVLELLTRVPIGLTAVLTVLAIGQVVLLFVR